VAQPDVVVGNEAVLQSPTGGDHLFAGKRLGVGRNGAGHGTGGALVTLLHITGSQAFECFDKSYIRL
jgi:hypothetical protein